MSTNNNSSSAKTPPLWFSRELFSDYWTALESRVRQDDDCDRVYSGIMPHPLIKKLYRLNRDQIIAYNCELVSDTVLTLNPIYPAELLITAITTAAAAAQMIPPLTVYWDEFREHWPIYKRAQRRIWAIAIATLQVGQSIHYARACQYGSGTVLLSSIYSNNRRNTTRSLFALFGILFTLQFKSGENFELFKTRFDLIINRFANWRPPIVLPKELLLFYVLRGLH